MFRRSVLVLTLAAGLAAAGALPARAHAVLLASTPAKGATVPAGTVPISLRFNSRVDRARSTLRVVAADGTETLLPATADSQPDTVRSEAELKPGSYRLRWQVLATDGHITRGDFAFTVTAGR